MLLYYKSFPSGILCSVCFAQPKIFVIAYIFDIMQLDNLLQIFLIAVITVGSHYKQELSNLPTCSVFPQQKLYQELGLESLQQRRWYRKLCYFFLN